MEFRKNLEKIYQLAGFKKLDYMDKAYEIYFETRKENKLRNDTPAHTMYPGYPHIENTTFSALEIFTSMIKGGFHFSEKDWMNLYVAGIRHDTGYWKDKGDNKGTGAKLTSQHVKRSMKMAEDYLNKKKFPKKQIDIIKEAISYTEVFGPKPKITSLGGILAGGDALGLISDPKYVSEYLPLLWKEFEDFKDEEGITMNKKLGYDTLKDIQGPKSAEFIRKILLPAVEPYLPYLKELGKDYRAGIQRNLDLLEKSIK